MTRKSFPRLFLPTIALAVLWAPLSTWAFRGDPRAMLVFPHRQVGPGLLSPDEKNSAPDVSPESLSAWENLQAQKGAQKSAVDWSLKTGLPHSVAFMQVSVEGKDLRSKAEAFLNTHKALFLKGEGIENLEFEKVRTDQYQAGHVDFLQKHKGLRVYGAGISVHFDREGNLLMVNGEYVPGLALANGDPGTGELTAEEALTKAKRRLPGPAWGVLPIEKPEKAVYSKYPKKGGNYLVYRYSLVGGGGGMHYILMADAFSGEPLEFFYTAAFLDGTASVFDPHRFADNAVQRTLTNLDDSGNLQGPLAVVADEENERVSSPARQFNFEPDSFGFRQASIYYYISETRRILQEYGFDSTPFGVIPAITNALDGQNGGPFNNAFYTSLGDGFVFGNGDGSMSTNLSQDFDIAAHEFGHFLDFSITNAENTSLHTPRRAWGEACGDAVAAVVLGDPKIGESSQPGMPGTPLRLIDNTARYPDDLVGEEHLDSVILGGAMWDYMKLRGGGTVTLEARKEMVKVIVAALPMLPPTGIQFPTFRTTFLQSDMARLGAGSPNQNPLKTAFDMHGITETTFPGKVAEKEAPKFDPDKLAGFAELQNGVPQFGNLGEGQFADFYIQVPAGATKLTVQTFAPVQPPQGDVILYVAPSNFTGPADVITSDFDFIPETIIVEPSTPIPLTRDTVWLVEVRDFIDGQFSQVGLVATVEGGSTQQTQELAFNTPVNGTISNPEEVDLYFFAGQGGQAVNLAVNKTGSQTLDPLVLIGDSAGNLLAFDDNSGGNQNALLMGFPLVETGNYLVAVQSAVTAQGPFSSGDYQLTLTTGVAVGPTPTPEPGNPNDAVVLIPGQSVGGTLVGSTQQQPSVSRPIRITVPEGARYLEIQTNQVPAVGNRLLLLARKGQPVGDGVDYIGLGGHRSTVVVTRDSKVPLTAGDYYCVVLNQADTNVDFEVTAAIDTGGGGGMSFDSDGDGNLTAKDLISLIRSNPSQGSTFFDFARGWKAPVSKAQD